MKALMKSRKKKNNKGFTLVELIVVLVILAILAAILVPALLGYIDRAKGQQTVLNARAVYTAAQAELTSMYAKTSDTTEVPTLSTADQKRIKETADVGNSENKATVLIGVAGTSGHAAFTVSEVVYQENGQYLYFDGKSWEECESSQGVTNKVAETFNLY